MPDRGGNLHMNLIDRRSNVDRSSVGTLWRKKLFRFCV